MAPKRNASPAKAAGGKSAVKASPSSINPPSQRGNKRSDSPSARGGKKAAKPPLVTPSSTGGGSSSSKKAATVAKPSTTPSVTAWEKITSIPELIDRLGGVEAPSAEAPSTFEDGVPPTADEIAQEELASTSVDVSEGDAAPAPPALTRQKSDPPSRPHPGAMKLELQRQAHFTMATITPPQTTGASPEASPTSGAHCLVLDVSGSMSSQATITNDDGDKVSHGFTLLDIVKHATCTYIASLSASDFVRVVEYGSNAREVAPWTACTDGGKATLDELVRGLQTRGSTNMVDGIQMGAAGFSALPDEIKASPQEYAMSLVVCTDGMPDAAKPPSHDSYHSRVSSLGEAIEENSGPAARPRVTAIGFGNSLNSSLLASFSDVFLHIPDPGSVGPFIVNLAAATRSTAKMVAPGAPGFVPSFLTGGGGGGGLVANTTRLILEPRSAVLAVPGFATTPWRGGSALAVDIGATLYDQPRHILVRTTDADATLRATLEVGGHELCTAAAAVDVPPFGDAGAEAVAFRAQLERVAVLCCLKASSKEASKISAPLARCADLMSEGPLKQTVVTEALLGLSSGKFATWGKHYVTTLPFMLRLERRSNFRDLCLQGFGKDAKGEDTLFEELSNEAEIVFAKLKPPTPTGARSSGTPTTFTSLPDEFMRGGGCFGPLATVRVVSPAGDATPVRVGAVRAGDTLLGEGGRLASVVCVVMTECAGGRAQLTRLANGLEITEWHPIREASSGRWRFPNMLGTQVIKATPYVYNFVLSPGHPTLLVDGVPCAALGHGLEAPVVAHPYWGTRAVIDHLRQRDGWSDGRVILPMRGADGVASGVWAASRPGPRK
jgi:hypothetical protein